MWCSTCQQDVPAIGQPATGRSVCARCHSVLPAPYSARLCDDGIALDEPLELVDVADQPPLAADDWQFRRQTRALGRKLRIEPGRPAQRGDTAHDVFDQLQKATATPIIEPAGFSSPRISAAPRQAEAGQVMAWLTTLAGTLVSAGGIGSIAWIIIHGGAEWWNHAIGLAIAGQALLVLGLAMVVTRLWRNSRYATSKLHEVHVELGQLQRTADALSAARFSGAPAFYADLVRGASPQMLLANLKGQIDQLTTRLGGGG